MVYNAIFKLESNNYRCCYYSEEREFNLLDYHDYDDMMADIEYVYNVWRDNILNDLWATYEVECVDDEQ